MRNKFAAAALSTVASLSTNHALSQEAETLVYVAVEPCRILDTRKSPAGPIDADNHRNFLVAGTAVDLAAQGGEVDCLNPKGEIAPHAISAYIIAAHGGATTSGGVLTAYPSDQPPPPMGAGSTVNFDQSQIIGNTTNATLCVDSCPADGELAILSRNTDQHVVVDVQGYYYPASTLESCATEDLAGDWQTFIAEESLGWYTCAVELDETGAVDNGSCAGDGGAIVTSGDFLIDGACNVFAQFFIDAILHEVQVARMSSDHNTIMGVVTVEGTSTTFSAMRY